MDKFLAFLRRCHSFIKKSDGNLHLTIESCDKMIGQTITLRYWFMEPSFLKRWRIKWWFKKLYRITKGSFGAEFREIPSLEIIDGEAIRKELEVRITFRNPYNELCIWESSAEKFTINLVDDWTFDPESPYWGWRERTEEARAQT
ncbi:MAG: hypothetical protein A2V69_00110 [Candidatus Portnoybacteria bacterium RBG_13_40_8]|uniref:Uncharacterized protein n=1 Tax=Candidatus Portnoybacteria bacterium RBG_13_40_8 TaxID=1801990 RepID=A0A1G2F330_9BACT|nr:MAG: hypothetical protein A2V69_00110 [Candidatus Portnoybacteria bacterium RBG_13_40_8]OGZ34530.1 MAG: hypothetical protein A2V60_03115 [Candidatus Portnoybacteria bacterium RIFCSPHIGHO2_01_FULL_39_19]